MTARSLLPHPLAAIFPRLTAESRQDLITSLEKGYDENHPIWIYKGMVLDGYNRYTLVTEINRRRGDGEQIVPVFREFTGDDDDAFEFVLKQNLRRRHLSEGERAGLYVLIEKRTGRKVRGLGETVPVCSNPVRESAPSGRTLPTVGLTERARAIEAKCAPRTLAKARQLDRLDPKALESVVYGGQSLNAALQRAKAAARALERSKPAAGVDAAGRAIHEAARQALTNDRQRFVDASRALHALKRTIRAISESPAGRLLNWQSVETDLDNVLRQLRYTAPYTSCPLGDPCDDGCRLCRGTQWISESQWQNLPREFKGSNP